MPSERSERGHPNKRQSGKITMKLIGELQHLFRLPRRALGPPRDDMILYSLRSFFPAFIPAIAAHACSGLPQRCVGSLGRRRRG